MISILARELQRGIAGQVRCFEPLSRHTTWRIGGPAELLVLPQREEDILFCFEFAKRQGLPLHIMGNGSNLLVLDGGVKGMVLQTKSLQEVRVEGDCIWATSGAYLSRILKAALLNGLGGMEFFAGIPATLGGGLVMNAGTPQGTLGEVVKEVWFLGEDGRRLRLLKDELEFSYRRSSLKGKGVVLAASLQLYPQAPELTKEKARAVILKKKATQPLEWPNGGSVFKNPPGDYAGRLIEAVGAKGWREGGAQVSTKHANFIVNLGGARARDVLILIDRVREAVFKTFGIALELEIEIWGEEVDAGGL